MIFAVKLKKHMADTNILAVVIKKLAIDSSRA